MIEVYTYCAKCGQDEHLLYEVCDECYKKLEDKFAELRGLSYDAQREITREYGAQSIEEAYVLKRFGPAEQLIRIICSRCKTVISEVKGEHKRGQSSCVNRNHTDLCDSCKSSLDEERERSTERDRRRFEGL